MNFLLDGNLKRGRRRHRATAPLPKTGWKAPKEFPRLSDARVISLDTETYDPELPDHGPGWARGKGNIVGVSLGADNDGRWYFPIDHINGISENMDRSKVIPWLSEVLGGSQPKVGANLYYDVGWLQWEGVDVKGSLYDVQFAEALLSENDPVNLDYLAEKYLGEHKKSEELYDWAAERFGGKAGPKQRANIYRSPPSIVGPYAESDADLPLRLMPVIWEQLQKYGLTKLFRMECDLIPLLVAMRMRGVRVDLDKAEQLNAKLKKQINKRQRLLNKYVGFGVDVYAANSLAKAFDKFKIKYNFTEKGAPSFTKPFMKNCDHELAHKINRLKELTKLSTVFLESSILNSNVKGRIHCSFNSMRSDDSGARSGRLSASKPNIQFIPSRDEKLAPLIRGLFLPDIGDKDWIKQDASQIEYRLLAHFARGKGASTTRLAYIDNPDTDYHVFTQQLILQQTGQALLRASTKTVNFGFIYGRGKKSLAKSMGLTVKKAEKLFEAYHAGAPYVHATMEHYSRFAQNNGYITTILGRRSLFEFYEPVDNDPNDRLPALRLDQALKEYGTSIKRAMCHKSLNRKLQGSAADILKSGMLKCWNDGLFDEVGVPLLTVHDELDMSNPGGHDHIFKEIKHACENVVKLRVPVIVDEERGPDWGHVEKKGYWNV